MQVNNQPIRQHKSVPDGPLELKQGEVIRASIKETLSDTDAILQIRGKEVRTRFLDGVPTSGNAVTIQVNGQADGMLQAKTITVDTARTASAEEKIFASAGLTGKETAGVKQAVRILLDKGLPVSKEIVQELDRFMEKAQGTLEEKIDTVRALANKRLETTSIQLRAVHEALNGKPLNAVLTAIAKEIDPEFKLEKKAALGEKQQIPNTRAQNDNAPAVTQKASNAAPVKESTSALQQVENNPAPKGTPQNDTSVKESQMNTAASKQTMVAKHASELSQTIRKNLELIQKEPDLKQAVARIKEEIVNNPKLDRELAQKIDKAAQEAVKLQSIGKERLVEALKTAEVQLTKNQQAKIQSSVFSQESVDINSQDGKLSAILKNLNQVVSKSPNVKQSIERVKEQIVNNERFPIEMKEKVNRALNQAASLEKQGRMTTGKELLNRVLSEVEGSVVQVERKAAQQAHAANQSHQNQSIEEQRPSVTVKEVKAVVQKAPSLQKAVEKVQEQVISNPKVDQAVAQKVEQAMKEAVQLQQIGREAVGRGHLQSALTKAEAELKQIEANNPAKRAQDSQPEQNQSKQNPKTEASQVRETIKHAREQIQSEPDTKRAIQKVRELLTNNKNLTSEISRNLERLSGQAGQLDQAGRDRLGKMLQQVEAALQQKADTDGQPSSSNPAAQTEQPDESLAQQTNGKINQNQAAVRAEPQTPPSQAIKQALAKLQKEPDLENALNQIRKEISGHPAIDIKTVERMEQALNHTQQLNDKGRELAARQNITNELTEMEQELSKTEPKRATETNASKDALPPSLNEQLQSLNMQGKDILITKVSQKLAQATHDFRELKREISRNLDNIERVINTFKKNAYPQAKQMLEATISKLDNAILKSEMMLFTDMRTEKQLLQASTQLAEAKKLLAKGDHAQAGKIIHDVKTLVDKIIFKPSEQKIVHFVDKEVLGQKNRTPSEQLLSKYSESTSNANQHQEASARQMYDKLRSLGLNHESDVANSLVFHKNDQPSQEHQQNLKEVLMKLAQGEGQETNPRVAQQAEQALTNLTGQQLLSKSDGNGTLQSMFFNLPLMLGGKPENLQVFINSKNEGEQVEWENCNLYFLLETKKLGDVGILLNSTDRNLSITIKNDLPGFKERMEPLAAMAKEKLQEIGYNVSNINFAKMNAVKVDSRETRDEHQAKPVKAIFTEKGMDFTI